MKLSRLILPLSILFALLWVIHRYVWIRLVRDAVWPAAWGHALTIAVVVLALLIPAVFLTMRSLSRTWALPLSWLAYTWMGLLFYLLLFTSLADMGKGLAALAGRLPQDPQDKIRLARQLSVSIAAAAGIFGLGGFLNVLRGFKVRRVRVPLAHWPDQAADFRIVQLSDVHVGPTIGRNMIENLVRKVNELDPELIVITGDLVDGTVEQLREHVDPLRKLSARHGVFFVTGNHEYYSGADEWIGHLAALGVRVLRNECVAIDGRFELAGVDDYTAAAVLPDHGQDIAKATAGRDPSRALVLLAHQPKAVSEALAHGVDLQISGHVHGGQIFPFNWLARLDQPLITGLHRVDSMWVYVSEGTGYWGPPMRVGTRCEISVIELVGGEAGGSKFKNRPSKRKPA